MPSIINSDNGAVSGSAGLKFDSADDGILHIQNSGNTAIAIASTGQATFTAPVSQPGGFSFRNRLINAQGLINQRGYVSGTNTSGANQYTVDRWRVVTSGQNLAFTVSENDTTFTAPAGGVEQVIEGLNLETGTYVLSWTGTATATVGGVSVTNGGTVSVTGGTNTTIRFSGGTFSRPQFEPGTSPTTFERRPTGLELSLCQRYYEVRRSTSGNLFAAFFSITAITSTTYRGNLTFVDKRAAPTITFSGSATFNGGVSPTSYAFQQITTNTALISGNNNASTVGYSSMIIANNNGTTLLSFDAEL
jgi:hypothetical protein